MNLNLLVALDALLHERNVTRAAKRVGVSQPAMSQSLANLRDVFDDALLVRQGDRMTPTSRALALAPALRRTLAQLQQVLDIGAEFDPASATGTLRIATGEHLAALFLPDLLAVVAAEAPALQVRMLSLAAGDTERLLRDDEVDIVVGPPTRTTASLSSTPVFDDEFACLVAATSVPKRTARLGLRRYVGADHIVISPAATGRSVVDSALEHRGEQRRVVARVASFVLAPLVVARTQLVLTAPRASLAAVSNALPVRVLRAPLALPSLPIERHVARRRADEPRMRWYVDALDRALQACGVT